MKNLNNGQSAPGLPRISNITAPIFSGKGSRGRGRHVAVEGRGVRPAGQPTTTGGVFRTRGPALAAAISLSAASMWLVAAPDPAASETGGWSSTEPMAIPRAHHTATLLMDGRVFVSGRGVDERDPRDSIDLSGGVVDTELENATFTEIYDPSRATWGFAGLMSAPRSGHTSTLLSDGAVLLVGGGDDVRQTTTASVEIYDTKSNSFRPTGPLSVPRRNHAATLLSDGRVLVSGGYSLTKRGPRLASAEIYDPSTGAWSSAGLMGTPRAEHTSTLLPDGKVLVVGAPVDASLPAAELFDPGTVTWSDTATPIVGQRNDHTATLLSDGNVLITGGDTAPSTAPELYDFTTRSWSATGTWAEGRTANTASLLPDGRVLVVGGFSESNSPSPAELYDPVTRTWSPAASLASSGRFHTSTLLRSGLVMVAGGDFGSSEGTTVANLFDPGPQPQRSVSLVLSKHLVATGVVGGPSPWCVSGAKVAILRNGSPVASATLGPSGSFKIQLPDATAKYQAKAKPSIVNDVPCNMALSPGVKHVH